MSKQRVSDAEIVTLKDIHSHNPERVGFLAYTLALDLADARAEIKRLQALSASQSEALDKMEAGQL